MEGTVRDCIYMYLVMSKFAPQHCATVLFFQSRQIGLQVPTYVTTRRTLDVHVRRLPSLLRNIREDFLVILALSI